MQSSRLMNELIGRVIRDPRFRETIKEAVSASNRDTLRKILESEGFSATGKEVDDIIDKKDAIEIYLDSIDRMNAAAARGHNGFDPEFVW